MRVLSEVQSQRLRDNYHLVARDILAPMADMMSVARATCDGDLDTFLILLAIASRTAGSPAIRELPLERVLSGEVNEYPNAYTNARSVAESTGIARETVRRKVARLVANGWVVRKGDDLGLTPHASRQLTPAREAIFDLAKRLHAVVERVGAG